jgi:hypothetical protein
MSCNVAMGEAIQRRAEFDLMMYHHRASPMTVKKHFQPGESVPETAVYAVIHDGHRAIHHATLRNGERFPECTKCADRVRFEILQSASFGRTASTKKQTGR